MFRLPSAQTDGLGYEKDFSGCIFFHLETYSSIAREKCVGETVYLLQQFAIRRYAANTLASAAVINSLLCLSSSEVGSRQPR
jgi:hypothetical protein